MIARRRGYRLCLAHVVPRNAPVGRGADRSHPEDDGHARRSVKEQGSSAAAESVAPRTFAWAKATLRKAGVPAAALDTQFFGLPGEPGVAAHVIGLARAARCRTIVVARESSPWFPAEGRTNLAEELVRCGRGFTVWVVQ